MANLNPGQFGALYHGTRADLRVGDRVAPPRRTGANPGPGTSGDPDENASGHYAFAIHGNGDHAFSDLDAEKYAWSITKRNGRGGGRARVLEVAPVHDMEPGDHHFDSAHSKDERIEYEHPDSLDPEERGQRNIPEYRSRSGFEVTKQIDIMPGRQGTFPQINWVNHNKHVVEDRSYANSYTMEMNHPADPHPDNLSRVEFRQIKDGEKYVDEHNKAQRQAEGLFPITPELQRRWR